jgi:NADPH-dependent glutamate synthase beta subunit-like oxidoreductase
VLCGGTDRQVPTQGNLKAQVWLSNGLLTQQTKALWELNQFRSNQTTDKNVIVIGGGYRLRLL